MKKFFLNLILIPLLGISLATQTAAAKMLTSIGSDTLEHLMEDWSEAYQKKYPDIEFSISAAGSSTAPPALTDSTADFAPMSRKMKSNEIQAFEQKYGYKPTAIRVAIDALAVFVSEDNPVQGLSIEQVDAIFSANRKCGAENEIIDWGDLGGPSGVQIDLYGRNDQSGTYGYFSKRALCKGRFSPRVAELSSSDEIVDRVAQSPTAMGYSGIGYTKPGVRAVPLTKRPGGDFIEATPENAVKGKYPLSRFLYIYVNKQPGKLLSREQRDFLGIVLSEAGQKIVANHGFISLPEKTINREKQKADS